MIIKYKYLVLGILVLILGMIASDYSRGVSMGPWIVVLILFSPIILFFLIGMFTTYKRDYLDCAHLPEKERIAYREENRKRAIAAWDNFKNTRRNSGSGEGHGGAAYLSDMSDGGGA